MNTVSFEEALASLIVMFPEWDQETLAELLTSNNYHVERTIESVLMMTGDIAPSTSGNSNELVYGFNYCHALNCLISY